MGRDRRCAGSYGELLEDFDERVIDRVLSD
jgi:hypothetical protein